MTRDNIIRMAREACDPDITAPAWDNGFWTLTQKELERFAALVAAAERDACAKVCDRHQFTRIAAAAIRARGAND